MEAAVINALDVQCYSAVIMTIPDMRKGWVNYVEIRFITVNVGLARRAKFQDLKWNTMAIKDWSIYEPSIALVICEVMSFQNIGQIAHFAYVI